MTTGKQPVRLAAWRPWETLTVRTQGRSPRLVPGAGEGGGATFLSVEPEVEWRDQIPREAGERRHNIAAPGPQASS